MRLVRVAQRPDRAWRNGGGRTRVVAQGPPDADEDDFGWRLSVAQVDRSGPFSAYPGVHRQLIVAGDEPLALVVGDERHDLRPGAVVAFDGGAKVSCEVTGGPVTAINVMTRPGVTAQVTIEEAAPDLVVTATEGSVLVVALTRHTALGRRGVTMAPQDTLWLETGEQESVSGGRVVVVRLTPQNV